MLDTVKRNSAVGSIGSGLVGFEPVSTDSSAVLSKFLAYDEPAAFLEKKMLAANTWVRVTVDTLNPKGIAGGDMRTRNLAVSTVISCALLLAVSSAAQEHPPEHLWDYGEAHGPSHWGDLEPEYAPCKNGHRQSPIDIRNPQKADLPPIRFDYKTSPLHIIDNGHTIMINYAP